MIPILMYHQIDKIPPKVDASGVRAKHRSLIVSPASFSRQMWLLSALGVRGVSMSDLLPYLRGENSTINGKKVIGITFDDGYQNNLIHALPVLQQYGFSSTCYAVSRLAGHTNSWDAANTQSGVQSKPLMTQSEMRQWIAGGQEIGSHTQHHVNLRDVDDALAEIEMKESKNELEAMTGAACQHFCYTYGKYDARHVAMAKAAGYMSATTTQFGAAQTHLGAHELPRIGVVKNMNLYQFWRLIRVQKSPAIASHQAPHFAVDEEAKFGPSIAEEVLQSGKRIGAA